MEVCILLFCLLLKTLVTEYKQTRSVTKNKTKQKLLSFLSSFMEAVHKGQPFNIVTLHMEHTLMAASDMRSHSYKVQIKGTEHTLHLLLVLFEI